MSFIEYHQGDLAEIDECMGKRVEEKLRCEHKAAVDVQSATRLAYGTGRVRLATSDVLVVLKVELPLFRVGQIDPDRTKELADAER